jgi:Uma2 family endonuclease
MGTITKPITFEESLLLPEDKCEEIVEGVQRHMPPASYNHARAINRLRDALRDRLPREQFEILSSNFGQLIRKSALTYRVPDLAVYRKAGLKAEHYVISVPELIVEAISPANRKGDLLELLAHYAEIRVPEVWFVALDGRELARNSGSNQAAIASSRASDPVASILLASVFHYKESGVTKIFQVDT